MIIEIEFSFPPKEKMWLDVLTNRNVANIHNH